MRLKLLILAAAIAGLSSCNHPILEVGPFTSGETDLSRPVFIGGTQLSGYRDGALRVSGQRNSVSALLAHSFGYVSGSGTQVCLPLELESGVGLNAKPWESLFQTASHLGQRTDCEGEQSLGPVKDTLSVSSASVWFTAGAGSGGYNDFGIPKATTADLLDANFSRTWAMGNPNPFFGRFATSPGSTTVMRDAIAFNPTFSVVWTGMDEILQYAQHGATGTAPDPAAFSTAINTLLDSLAMAGSKGVVCNLPPLASLPFFTTIPWDGAELDQVLADSLNGIYDLFAPHIHFEGGPNGFVVADPAAPVGVRQLVEGEYLLLTLPLDSVKCQYMGLLGATIPDQYELIANEVAEINALITSFNTIIADAAQAHGFAHANLNSFFTLAQTGVYADGVKFNCDFVSGNIYSLDGITFTGKGSALVANDIIKSINAYYHAALPPVQVYEQDGVLFP